MSYITDWILSHRWAITPQALLAIVDIANRVSINIDPKIFHGDFSTMSPEYKEKLGITKETLTPLGGRCLEGTCSVQVFKNVGVIDIFGPIFPRSSSMSLSSPGITVTMLNKAITMALDSPEVDNIVLNIDSPGGEITDIEALSDKIFNARSNKPIIAFVTGMAASAGYWIASSASEIVAAKTSEVGSIGVVAALRDTSEKDEKAGIKNINIVSSVSPKKRPDYRTEEGQADIKSIVDELGMMFVETVARNRGTDKNDVIANYGQGSMILSTKAIGLGMVDRIDSLENVISKLNNQSTGGIHMDTLVKNATAESIKAENPNAYKIIFDEGAKKGANLSKETENQIKDDAFKAGAEHENARIKDVESLEDSENKEIIAENKFNMEMTKEDVAVVILEKQKEKTAKKGKDIKEDGEKLADENIKTTTSEGDEEEKAEAAKTMSNAMNQKRGIKK
jgi:signal peptide peptidase SppA